MAKHRRDEYQYPCAVIRGNERTLLGKADMNKIAEAPDVQAAMNILADFGYGDGKPLENPRDFERALREEQKRFVDLVLSVVLEKEELEFLQYPADYHNVKVILKSEILEISPDAYLTAGGTVESDKLAYMIQARDYMFMEPRIKEAMEEAVEGYAKNKDPQEIDIILDKACYRDMLKAAEAGGNDFVIGYVKLLIDILNILTFVRLRKIKKSETFLRKVLLEGGKIDLKTFVDSYNDTYQVLGEKLDIYGFKEIMELGAATVEETGKYSLLEKLCDDAKVRYIQGAKFVTTGLEPIAAFYIAKENEIKNLRMVLTGKLAGTAEETIKERLRETYV